MTSSHSLILNLSYRRYKLEFTVNDPHHKQEGVRANVTVHVTTIDLHDDVQEATLLSLLGHAPRSLISFSIVSSERIS